MKNKKKTVILVAAVILMMGICTACMLWMRTPGIHFLFGFVPDHVTAEIDGVNYSAVIDSNKKTITTPDGIVYSYTENASKTSFIYPDGKECLVEHSESNTVMAADQDIDAENYLAMNILWELYQQKSTVPEFLLVRILGTVLGSVMVIFPKVFWVFRYGWLFKNAEVNPPALWVIRFSGIVVILWMFLF